jgi:hypothetical protein
MKADASFLSPKGKSLVVFKAKKKLWSPFMKGKKS